MKRLLSLVLVCLFTLSICRAEQPPADDILAFVREKLPNRPLRLTGSLKVKARNGHTQANLPVSMKLNWGAAVPSAQYTIARESLKITWEDESPSYHFSNPDNTPSSNILNTGLTWADLSFSVLWWPNAKLVGEEKRINRACHVVDVPIPGTDHTMRLWIEQKMGMLFESKTLDENGKELRRLKIKSIKKTEGMWIAKDLELRDKKSGSKTTLQISDLTWMDQ